ncbi:unnamed protein product [Thlaspi arvense]|uniref:Uncharacterized protein n=1 Tax=Thlaspi arvense TaxID=13288 RepID=A0AAU9SHX4_THLAR|nr:unnamed protein product [Thlaspi arvense]
MVYSEGFLHSMKDLSEDSNSCNWSLYCGDNNLPNAQNQNGVPTTRAAAESHRPGNERDFLKQTMLEHEAVFKNQVHELHRLYRTQKSLMDEAKGKSSGDNISQSERTPESVIKRDLPGFLMGSSMCGEGSSSQPGNVAMPNGNSSKGEEVVEVRPEKVRRRMIDLQLPADEYLDADCRNTSFPPYEQSKAGNGVGEKMFSASHRSGSSGSSLVMRNSNGVADLNEPVQCQLSLPTVTPSMDIYSLYGSGLAHVQRQGQWLKNTNQNAWMVLQAGNGRSTPRDKLCLPSHSAQGLSSNAFQPLGYPSADHRKLPGERGSYEWEARQRNPEASYDSYVESSVASNAPSVASNAPSLHHGYRPESVRPWSHWISSWENQSSSSVQRSLPPQTNPFLSYKTQARAVSSSEMRSRDFDGHYQGFSSGSKETAINLPSGNFNHLNSRPTGAVTSGSLREATLKHRNLENLQGPKMQEPSGGLPWIKPKLPTKNGIANGGLDLNASANQFMDGSDAGGYSNNASPHNGLRSFSCTNDAHLRKVEMADSLSSSKILGFPFSQKQSIREEHSTLNPSSVCIIDQPKEAKTLVKRHLDINLPCEASVSEAIVFDKAEGKKPFTNRHYIDLNLCASEDEDFGLRFNPRVETKATMLIDLEAPPALESEEEEEKLPEKRDEATWGSEKGEAGDSLDEPMKAAAEALVTISLSNHWSNTDEAASSTTDPVAKDPLSWFVNTIASCGSDLEKKIDACLEARDCEGYREECSSGEFDYFEAMTLNLPQTKEEDYMPEPLVPEHLNFDGAAPMGITANRPRRGQARRGRSRRDFQRDTLPGLVSLSRLEITEDLQVFGGLMRATGYNWSSGVTRRSSNRGRRRLVSNVDGAPVCSSSEQPVNSNSVQTAGLEDRSLTGWGNATRRPRRQRCPADPFWSANGSLQFPQVAVEIETQLNKYKKDVEEVNMRTGGEGTDMMMMTVNTKNLINAVNSLREFDTEEEGDRQAHKHSDLAPTGDQGAVS